MKKQDGARARLRKQLDSTPNDPKVLKEIGREYLRKKEYKLAVKYLERALAIGEDALARHWLAAAYKEQGDFQKAIAQYTACRDLLAQQGEPPALAQIYLELGALYYPLNTAYAFYCYAKAGVLAPHLVAAHDKAHLIAQHFLSLCPPKNWAITGNQNFLYPDTAPHPSAHAPLTLELEPPSLDQADDGQVRSICRWACANLVHLIDTADTPEKQAAILEWLSTKHRIGELLENYPDEFGPVGQAWINAFLRCLAKTPARIGLYWFKLPPLFDKYCWERSTANKVLQQARQLLEGMASRADLQAVPLQHNIIRLLIFLIDALCQGSKTAFHELAGFWQKISPDRLTLAFFAPVWHLLFHTGWHTDDVEDFSPIFRVYGVAFADLIARHHAWQSQALPIWNMNVIKELLQYNLHSSRKLNALIFKEIILPNLHHALNTGSYLYADRLASATDYVYAQQPHTEEQSRLCWESYLPAVLESGRRLCACFSPSEPTKRREASLKIGFVVNSLFNLASPLKVLRTMLESVGKLSPPPFQAKVYAFYGVEENAIAQEFLAKTKIAVVDLAEIRGEFEKDDYLQRLSALRELIRKDGTACTVYVHSSMFFMAFAGSLGLSPVQVFWSMGGQYSFRIPEIQGYIIGSLVQEGKKLLGGQEWRCFPLKMWQPPVLYNKLDYQAKQIRAEKFSQYNIILGCIARAQKLDNDEFIDTLEKILNENPGSVFLWFGDKQLKTLENKMKQKGILARCLFQGFVDADLYARVLDIHLDCFPYPTGIAALQCMAAGTPCVFMEHEEGAQHLHSNIYEILSSCFSRGEQQSKLREIFFDQQDGNLLLYSKNQDDYINYVSRLIKDKKFRKLVGNAGYKFVSDIYHSIDSATSFYSAIQEIIREAHVGIGE